MQSGIFKFGRDRIQTFQFCRQHRKVGDKLQADILGANQAGLFSVWINRRVDEENLPQPGKKIQPDAVISSLEEFPALLKRLQW